MFAYWNWELNFDFCSFYLLNIFNTLFALSYKKSWNFLNLKSQQDDDDDEME